MISDLNKADRTCEWLMMHGLTDIRVMASGCTIIGSPPLLTQDPSIFNSTHRMEGIYECQLIQLQLHGRIMPRAGYESNTANDLYNTVTYFSTGANIRRGKKWFKTSSHNMFKKGPVTDR